MMVHRNPALAAAIALALGLGLSACGGQPANRTLYSVKQPVVETSTYALDLVAGAGGLPGIEQRRLAEWFEALELGYGDRIALHGNAPSDAVRKDVAAIAGSRGLLLSDATPVTPSAIAPGSVRVAITRSHAHVPGCPDWSDRFGGTLGNRAGANYGCATNGNIAAMMADPAHLIEGVKGTGETVVMTSNKAIESYREQSTTGAGGLRQVDTSGD